MGSLTEEDTTEDKWKNDGIFTGKDECFPVELFIYLMEEESNPREIAQNAMQSLCVKSSPKLQTVVGSWGQECSWEIMRADLIALFGRLAPYTILEIATLVASLTKGPTEHTSRFLLRVQWVLKLFSGDDDFSVRVQFLAGLNYSDREPFSKQIEDKSIKEAHQFFKNDPHKIKVDPLEMVMVIKEEAEDEDMVNLEIKYEIDSPAKNLPTIRDEYMLPQDTKDELHLPKLRDECMVDQDTQHKTPASKNLGIKLSRFTVQNSFCGMCQQSFADKSQWNYHEENQHLGTCLICDLEIGSDLKLMREHQRKEHKGKQVKCPDCSCYIYYSEYGQHKCHEKYKRNSRAERSKNQIKNRFERMRLRVYTLKDDEKIEEVKAMTFEFNRVVEGKVQWICGHCRQEFLKQRLLRKHIQTAHDNKVFKCDICDNYTAGVFDNIVKHKVVKHDVATESYDLFRCTVEGCGFKCTGQAALDHHTKGVHDETTIDDRTCKVCSKTLTSPACLKAHVESVHMKMEKVKCKVCYAKFLNDKALEQHMKKRHSKPEEVTAPVQCPICGNVFQKQRYLNMHMRTHGGPMKCEPCDKTFKNMPSYHKHVRTVHKSKEGIKNLLSPKVVLSEYSD